MEINADFSRAAVIDRSATEWLASPAPGVDRIMLDRIGAEVARATSIVRYAPGSAFARHEHAKGEEFLVLEGVFSDESGHYPAGTYVRNPPGTGHAPYSESGCRILVKLRQFDPGDLTPVVINTLDSALWQNEGSVEFLPLHAYGAERVSMRRLGGGDECRFDADPGGVELLVVDGAIVHAGNNLAAESWLRFPPGHENTIVAAEKTLLWIKRGHLPV